jgi:hypothetical protein
MRGRSGSSKEPGPHAEEGEEVLKGMYAHGHILIEESKISGRSGRAGGEVSASGDGKVLPVLFRRTPGPYQRDYYTSANHDGLQGVKNP